MDAVTCIKTRRSIREFKPQDVSKDTIEELVQVSAFAPSWKNTQTTRYIAITDPETKSLLAEQCCAEHNQGIIGSAPVLVATTIVDQRSGSHDKGLGTVIMGLYDINKAEEILDIPEGQILMALIAVGYPAQEPAAPKRKPVEDLLTFR